MKNSLVFTKKRKGILFGAAAMLLLTACGTQVSSQGGNAVVAQSPISEAKVKEIVAKETGLNNLVYEKIILKTDDNRRVYEVDTFLDGKEYDFDIDAVTGEIIASNKEGQLQRHNQQNANEQVIDEARVKRIVAEKTQEQEAKLQFVRIQLTQDDDYNRAKIYEVEAFSETKDYDLDIHAVTGEVLKFESEAYQGVSQPQAHQIPQSPQATQQQAAQQQAAQQQAAQQQAAQQQAAQQQAAQQQAAQQQAAQQQAAQQQAAQQQAAQQQAVQQQAAQPRQNAVISADQARSIAARHTGVGNLAFYAVYLTNEDDYGYRPVYHVDAQANGWEYDLDIDAATGQVLSFDKDYYLD